MNADDKLDTATAVAMAGIIEAGIPKPKGRTVPYGMTVQSVISSKERSKRKSKRKRAKASKKRNR